MKACYRVPWLYVVLVGLLALLVLAYFFSVGGSTQHSAVAPHSGLSAHAPNWWAREALITWNEP